MDPSLATMSHLRIVGLLALALGTTALRAEPVAGPVAADHVVVELVARDTAVAPGAESLLGLRLAHEPHWHTYWINPGDSGLATKLAWLAPAGLAAEIRWPAPKRLPLGPLVNYGYEGEIVLPIPVRVPDDAQPGDRIDYAVRASWLVCKEECIPGRAELSLSLPVAREAGPADPRWRALFEAAAAATPRRVDGVDAQAVARGDGVEVVIEGLPGLRAEAVELFPVAAQVIANARGEAFVSGPGALTIRTPRSDAWNGLPARVPVVLVDHGGTLPGPVAIDAIAAVAGAGEPRAAVDAGDPALSGVLIAVAFAFLGGVLLNLMPCVFPVLSLKAMGLVAGGEGLRAVRRHGLYYLAGCVLAFVALAGLLLSLRAGGEQLGWGFQLQSPWVVAALALLMLAMGLSLSGWFEIGGGWMNLGQSLTEGHGDRSAFFTGVLACVVASPCTAPFMGPALGFAITQPAAVALGVFAALGAGLAAPLVLVSFVPALAHRLPRPGAWMERFRQLMAFPMYLTAVWLLWVLGRQTGADGMALALAAAVLLACAAWFWRLPARWIGRTAAVMLGIAAAGALSMLGGQSGPSTPASAAGGQAWSPERLAELRARGEPVLVNMTAAWCITCLANERVALSSERFEATLAELGVRYLKGDWTEHDAAITAYLRQFGRTGVPLYVLYPRGDGAPEVLPQLLTPAIVDAALRRAAGVAAGTAVTEAAPAGPAGARRSRSGIAMPPEADHPVRHTQRRS